VRNLVEYSMGLPRDELDLPRLSNEVRAARPCGTTMIPAVLINGRRYEDFERADPHRKLFEHTKHALAQARPVAEKPSAISKRKGVSRGNNDEQLPKRVHANRQGFLLPQESVPIDGVAVAAAGALVQPDAVDAYHTKSAERPTQPGDLC
jgi:hypothetical protein